MCTHTFASPYLTGTRTVTARVTVTVYRELWWAVPACESLHFMPMITCSTRPSDQLASDLKHNHNHHHQLECDWICGWVSSVAHTHCQEMFRSRITRNANHLWWLHKVTHSDRTWRRQQLHHHCQSHQHCRIDNGHNNSWYSDCRWDVLTIVNHECTYILQLRVACLGLSVSVLSTWPASLSSGQSYHAVIAMERLQATQWNTAPLHHHLTATQSLCLNQALQD